MKKYILLGAYLLLFAGLSSCDDGPIYEKTGTISEEGRTLKMSGIINGISKWPDSYSIVVAGFSDESEYAVVTKTIPVPAIEGDKIQVTMTGISDEVSTVELCVINKLRKRIISFQSMDDLTAADDTIRMDAGTVNADMYNAIQQDVFDKGCIGCHGIATSAAAGLSLLEGNSYQNLVGHSSSVVTGLLRVKAGSAEESVLHQILNTTGWKTNHSNMITEPNILTLIDDWIDNGAQE